MATLIIGFLLSWGLFGQSEATSAEIIPTRPLVQKSTDVGVHTIIIEAPSQALGIRRVAAYVDQQVAGIDIWARRGIVCDPDVTCIRVTVADYGPFPVETCGALRSWAGCALIGDVDPWIKLNTYFGTQQSVGCHELLHALGLDHHTGLGCVGLGGRLPSTLEIETLRGLYG